MVAEMALRMIDLQDLAPADAVTFGGKACDLAGLAAVGAEVPPGFAVEATAVPVAQWSDADRDQLRRRATALGNGGLLAVRSSAIGEDGADRSFAGMFETVLGVADPDGALSAAARCIASAHNPRVRAYAANGPQRADGVAVGVLVQTQVAARAAGVCFTVDPSGTDGAIVLEAVAGTGDLLMSGHAPPERWRVYRSGRGTWEVRRDGGAAPVLTSKEAIQLAEQAAKYAEQIGYPLDLEWAIDSAGKPWWLQARPITVAPSPPRFHIDRACDAADDGPISVWFNWNVRETLPDPLMPLTWSLWRDLIVPVVMSPMVGTSPASPIFPHLLPLDLVHGRIYFNMNGILAWPVIGALMRGSLMRMVDPEGSAVCDALISSGVLQARRLPGSRARLAANVLRASLVSAWRFAASLRPRRAMAAMRTLEADIRRRVRERPLGSLADAALLDELRLVAAPEFDSARNGIHYMTMAIAVYRQATRAFRGYPDACRLLAVAIPENPTTQISVGIDGLIGAARPLAEVFHAARSHAELLAHLAEEPQGRAWLEQFHDFLARFGHRCPKEFDLGAARWRESPDMIIELIRVGLESAAAEGVTDRLDRLAGERRAAVNAAVTAAPRWRRPILRWLARQVELYMPLREAPKHAAMLAFQRMRETALELGRRLSDRGDIAARDDVFFLEMAELQQLVASSSPRTDVRALVSERRTRFERFCAARPPDYLRSDGVPVERESDATYPPCNGALRGTGISTGRATGPVRILREPNPRAMSEGDVIVMQFADPGWTPLFPRAAAVVMEVGGLMCHAAVVARELGIPGVFGVAGATRALRDGQAVVVDGDQGTVTPATPSGAHEELAS
jgi:rifampicin phosphotransferase